MQEIFGVLWGNAVLIILCGLLFAMMTFVITKLFITPEYKSTTKMYVLSQQSDSTLTQGDMQTSTYLTKDYAELIKSRTVTEAVIAGLELDMLSSELLNRVSISTPLDTRVINISVTDEDPYKAAEIANAIRDVAGEHIQKVMNIEAVNTVETANIPLSPSSPNIMKNVVFVGGLGAVLVIALVLIMYLVKGAIQTSEDVEKYLELGVLGMIPLEEGEKKSKKKRIFFKNGIGRGV